MNQDKYKEFNITSVCRADLDSIGFNTEKITDEQMNEIASKMAEAYTESCFWIDAEIICEGVTGLKAGNM